MVDLGFLNTLQSTKLNIADDFTDVEPKLAFFGLWTTRRIIVISDNRVWTVFCPEGLVSILRWDHVSECCLMEFSLCRLVK